MQSNGHNSKLDRYVYQLGLGRMPLGTTTCSLAIDLFPAPAWYAAAVAELADNNWFDEQTRVVELKLNLYNPTLDVAALVEVRCEAMASGAFACQRAVQAMPVLLPSQQYSATQTITDIWWFNTNNWAVFSLMVACAVLNVLCVVCECHLAGEIGLRRYFACRGFWPADQKRLRITRVTATVLSGECCNSFTWIVEVLLVSALALKTAVWASVQQVFMLDTATAAAAGVAQLRFSTQFEDTFAFSDVSQQHVLFQASVVMDAICVWGLLMLALKYFHVNVFNSFLVRAFSIACDSLANVGLALAVMLGSLFVWHYFLFVKTTNSLLFARPDYSFLRMLMSSPPFSLGASSPSSSSSSGGAVDWAPPVDVQVVSILFAMVFAVFVLLIMLPLLASVLIGVVVKLAELVGVEGYYWLTPPHLLLSKRQQRSEYSRVFASQAPTRTR